MKNALAAATASLLVANNISLAESDQAAAFPDGRHRLDLSVTHNDSGEGRVTTLSPSYSMAMGGNFRLGIGSSFSFVDSDESADAEALSASGWGDLSLHMQYAPSARITASPAIPDNVGLSALIIAPTGDASKGLGSDTWALELGLGWSFKVAGGLWLVPAAYYANSVNEGRYAVAFEETGISVDLVWLFDNGIWIGYRPTLAREHEANEWADDHYMVAGKQWPGGFGISLEYGARDRLDRTAVRDDYETMLNFFYQFGKAP